MLFPYSVGTFADAAQRYYEARSHAEKIRAANHAAKKIKGEVNGSAGVPRKGREEEYATELWLEGPSAFWLHPEGPLSDTTPEEWRAKRKAERDREDERRRDAQFAEQQRAASVTTQYPYGLIGLSQLQNPYFTNYPQARYRGGLFGLAGVLP